MRLPEVHTLSGFGARCREVECILDNRCRGYSGSLLREQSKPSAAFGINMPTPEEQRGGVFKD